jgi:hypothetical protein
MIAKASLMLSLLALRRIFGSLRTQKSGIKGLLDGLKPSGKNQNDFPLFGQAFPLFGQGIL